MPNGLLAGRAKSASALAILKRPTAPGAGVVVPLLSMAIADATDVATLVLQQDVTGGTPQIRRQDWRCRRLEPLVRLHAGPSLLRPTLERFLGSWVPGG